MTNTLSIEDSGRTLQPEQVKVWDPLVRLFHWSLLGLFVFAWFTGDEWARAHEWAGYAIAGLLAMRIIWGFAGSTHARFSDFVCRPASVILFLKESVQLRAKRYLGHNPAGGAMAIALITSIAGICLSGFLMTTDTFWGAEWVEEAHGLLVDFTLVLIVLHVAGVILASIEHGENLVKSMITGMKRRFD